MNGMEKFGKVLVEAQLISRADCERAFEHIEGSTVHLAEFLVEGGLASDTSIVGTISKALKLPRVSLETAEPDPRALEKVPEDVCRHRLVLPLEIAAGKIGVHLILAMANPLDAEAIQHVAEVSDMRIKPFVASAQAVRGALNRIFGLANQRKTGRPFRRSVESPASSISRPNLESLIAAPEHEQSFESFVAGLATAQYFPKLTRTQLLGLMQKFADDAPSISERLVLHLLRDLLETDHYQVNQVLSLLKKSGSGTP